MKAAIVTLDGVERALGRCRTPWQAVATGAEIDPYALVETALEAARAALAGAPEGRIAAVGITSMAETGVLLDRAGEPVVPAIAWHDARGEREAEQLSAAIGAEVFTTRTGLPASLLCSLSKYCWMRANWAASGRGARWLNVAEWVVRSLGGDEVAELSLASRTGLLDLKTHSWWREVLDWAEAPSTLLPDPVGAGTPAGRVTRGLDETKGAVLIVAGHDHLCASVGAGATRPDDVLNSCGTAEAFVRAFEPPIAPADILRAVAGGVTVGWHVLPSRYALMAGFQSGLARQRFLQLLGVADERGRAELDAAALALPEGAEGVAVHGITEERVIIAGVPQNVTPGHVWRAALEAVEAYGAGVLATIESIAGPTGRIVVSGGGARNDAVRALKRDALGPFEEPPVEEAGARGAALIAGFAAGLYPDLATLPAVEAAGIQLR